jgi:thiamine transporter
VWAGISIPTAAATIYSLIYNATYMLPETIITVLVAVYLGSTVEFRKDRPARMQTETVGTKTSFALKACGGLAVLVGLIADIALVFSKLQNADSGEFDITGLASVNWAAVGILSGACVLAAAALFLTAILLGRRKTKKNG